MGGWLRRALGFDWFDVRALERLVTAGLVVATIVALMALAGVSSIGFGGVGSGAPLEVDLDPAKVAPDLNQTLPAGVDVEAVRATIVSRPSGLWEQLLVRLQVLPIVLLALAVLVLTRRIVRSVVAGDPFVEENVRRLRIIGWLVALSPILLVLAQLARSDLISRSSVGDLALSQITIAFVPILIGGLLLVLAEVFAAGVQLRQDTEGLV
jgi:hypothetical protein